MSKYWLAEHPQTITTAKNVLQYYPEAGKLSVAREPWFDDAGNARQGKTVCLDISALMEAGQDDITTARGVFSSLVDRIDARLRVL